MDEFVDKEHIKYVNRLVLWVFGGFIFVALIALGLEKIFGGTMGFFHPLS